MSRMNRRKFLTAGVAATAGVGGLALAGKLADRFGLIPPDAGTLYGPGETLSYATQRLFERNALAREFSPSQITRPPFRNEIAPALTPEYFQMERNGFRDWRLKVDGLVAEPASFSVSDIRALPARSQVTMLSCEEGWSYIGEWTGAPLSHLLKAVGVKPEARYVVYRSFQGQWDWDSIDMYEAMHPQTLIAYGINGSDMTPLTGAPLRLRLPRQIGYKSVEFLSQITVVSSLKGYGKGSGAADGGYAWFAGI
ncbi:MULTISPECIES: molybdopterin-dependent oxidoreductase [Acidobacterium]|uniref:Oxidoreductase, molybdopterin-binding n=1 Tax=Acidobacterium capsulatum (strain ATCC 51196 / DSM 11244 / BCRC 80197 / JCM 7670 / NBRC 15755 / NCIMB 13165 / 161) TaxID=240015 RepID=C1F928_ACIC5|nr:MULTISPECIES: molybdopterin-dependent oxidoreductase [Acidobacterium]ACO32662.1 oxidoreductase, molybdopterin-binding [Acidobacterium capsulatum ATCC 51196]HCT62150.1 oxidoreductase [Acidobacterium sp.]